MPTMRIVTALAAAALVLAHSAAYADEPTYECQVRAYPDRLDNPTRMDDWLAVGVVAHDDAAVSIRCYFELNGATLSTTQTVTGDGAAVVVDRLSYYGDTTTGLSLCAKATVAGHPDAVRCRPFRVIQVPPQEVIDLVNDAFVDHVDPLLCDVLADVDEPPGPVVVDEEGDLYVLGEPMWDCPPYDIWPPA